jgi:hypothetical protein
MSLSPSTKAVPADEVQYREALDRLRHDNSEKALCDMMDVLVDNPFGRSFLLIDQFGCEAHEHVEMLQTEYGLRAKLVGFDLLSDKSSLVFPRITKERIPVLPRLQNAALEEAKRARAARTRIEDIEKHVLPKIYPTADERWNLVDGPLTFANGVRMLQQLHAELDVLHVTFEKEIYANSLTASHSKLTLEQVIHAYDEFDTITTYVEQKIITLIPLANEKKPSTLGTIRSKIVTNLTSLYALLRLPRSPRPGHPPGAGGRNA